MLMRCRYTSLQANYLTIPVYIFACICLFSLTWTSDRIKKRGLVAFFAPMPVLIGYILVIATSNVGVGYFAMSLCGGGKFPYQ